MKYYLPKWKKYIRIMKCIIVRVGKKEGNNKWIV